MDPKIAPLIQFDPVKGLNFPKLDYPKINKLVSHRTFFIVFS